MAGEYVAKMLDPEKTLSMLRQYSVFCDSHGSDKLSVKTVTDSHKQRVMDLTADGQAQDFLHVAKESRIMPGLR